MPVVRGAATRWRTLFVELFEGEKALDDVWQRVGHAVPLPDEFVQLRHLRQTVIQTLLDGRMDSQTHTGCTGEMDGRTNKR